MGMAWCIMDSNRRMRPKTSGNLGGESDDADSGEAEGDASETEGDASEAEGDTCGESDDAERRWRLAFGEADEAEGEAEDKDGEEPGIFQNDVFLRL